MDLKENDQGWHVYFTPKKSYLSSSRSSSTNILKLGRV